MSGDLYRLIPEEGKHLAESRDTKGAYRGVYLDDDTNKPSGAGEFIKIEDDKCEDYDNDSVRNEMDGDVAAITGLIAIGIGIGVAATKAYPHVKEWVGNTAVPGMKKFWYKIRNKDTAISMVTDETVSVSMDVVSAQDFADNVDVVLDEYQKNMSSKEAQVHLLNIMSCAMYMVSEIRKISNVVVNNEVIGEERLLEWKFAMEKLTTQTVTDSINRILEGNVLSMNETDMQRIAVLMGDTMITNGVYVPIKNEKVKELLRLTE